MATNRWRQPGFLILICVVFVALFIDFIPPDDMTVTAIGETACRIHLHLKRIENIPKDFSSFQNVRATSIKLQMVGDEHSCILSMSRE